jgi:hypothetical protein
VQLQLQVPQVPQRLERVQQEPLLWQALPEVDTQMRQGLRKVEWP